MGGDARGRRLLGLLLLISVLVLNEWVLGPLFADDGAVEGTKLLAVRGFDLFALLAGLLLLFTRRSLGGMYRDAVMVTANSLVLLLILNLIAWIGVRDVQSDVYIGGMEMTFVDPEHMRDVYQIDDIEAIKSRLRSPGASGHPALQMMMRPAKGAYYNSGAEGSRRSCREGAFVDDALDGAIWMFGGSTTYGSGVADCETIASALNAIDPGNRYINFGVESRNQSPEIDHLLLLLRKGYRPKAVIFLDGLNDIDINILQEPSFSAFEAPAVPQQPYYFAIQNQDGVFLRNLLMRMPLMQAMVRMTASGGDSDSLAGCGDGADIYRAGDDYHENPLGHYGRMSSLRPALKHLPAEKLEEGPRADCSRRLLGMYRSNGEFLQAMGRQFGFEAHVFFQPLAILAEENPFLRHPGEFRATALYAMIDHLVAEVRGAIAGGGLPGFHDLSRLGMDCGDCWVDPNHYSPRFNRRLAEAVHGMLQGAD